MKLKTLAIAVAVASMPFAAQADLTISGDVGVGYFSSSEKVEQFGSEINFDASEKVGGVTYSGHAELESSGNFDEFRVGAKGGFGEIILGDADNGCNQVDIGGTNEVNLTHTQGGCQGASDGNIIYKRALGNFSGAVSHNPDAEQTTFGIAGSLGPVGVSLGYETDITSAGSVQTCSGTDELTDIGGTNYCVSTAMPTVVGTPTSTSSPATLSNSQTVSLPSGTSTASTLENNLVLGITGKLGPVSIGFRANKLGDNDAVHGINGLFSRGAHNIYGGLGTSDGNDSKSLGYKHVRGKTDFIIEASDSGVSGADTEYGVGMRHRF